MRFSLESMGGSLEKPKKVERIDNLGSYEYPSRAAIDRYLDVISSTENLEAFNIAFSRFSRAIEHAKTIEDYETIMRDIGIYERSVILSYDEMNALYELTTRCDVQINLLKISRELKRTNVSKPLDYIDEVKEMGYTSIFHDSASDPSESLIPSNSTTQDDDENAKLQEELRAIAERWELDFAKEGSVHLNDQTGNPSESLVPSNSTTQDDEELDSLKELRTLLNEIGGNEPPKDKKQLDSEVKQILESLEDSSLVDIVPTKEPAKAKVHVIKARKKKVPKKVTIKKITKPGLPGEMLEEDTSNLTKRR